MLCLLARAYHRGAERVAREEALDDPLRKAPVTSPTRRRKGEELGRHVAQMRRARALLREERVDRRVERAWPKGIETRARPTEHGVDHGDHVVAEKLPVESEPPR